MTADEFMNYYEKKHSQLSKRLGRSSSMPGAVRYVRRYLIPETNPVTGQVIDPGFDCIMEIWWKDREEFERSQRIISDPERLAATKQDELNLFASHDNPVCTVVEFDSPMGPPGEATFVEVRHGD